MSKAYKGYELIKEIAEGNIKDNTKIIPHYPNNNCTIDYFIYRYGFIHAFTNGIEKENVNVCIFLDDVRSFVIEEEPEIDIQGIEETEIKNDGHMDYYKYFNNGATESGFSRDYSCNDVETREIINQLIKAVKQLDNKINNK